MGGTFISSIWMYHEWVGIMVVVHGKPLVLIPNMECFALVELLFVFVRERFFDIYNPNLWRYIR